MKERYGDRITPTLETIADLARSAGIPDTVVEHLLAEALPTALLIPRYGEDATVGATKLGGLPDLPPDADWPATDDRMTFCGQLRTEDLAVVHGIDEWRPEPALLSFFVDKSPETDEIGLCSVRALALDDLERRPEPGDLDEMSRFGEAPVDVVAGITVPSLAEHGHRWDYSYFDHKEVLEFEDELAKAYGWRPGSLYARHQVFGHPTGDGEPVSEKPDGERRLLLCVSGDDKLGVHIMDGGSVAFWIPAEDLAAGRYDRVFSYETDIG